jgi:hypothetical protein
MRQLGQQAERTVQFCLSSRHLFLLSVAARVPAIRLFFSAT